MNNGVNDKLNYLEATKDLIKQSIKKYDSTIDDSTEFREYPSHIQNIIDASIIPQSTVEELANNIFNINGEEV